MAQWFRNRTEPIRSSVIPPDPPQQRANHLRVALGPPAPCPGATRHRLTLVVGLTTHAMSTSRAFPTSPGCRPDARRPCTSSGRVRHGPSPRARPARSVCRIARIPLRHGRRRKRDEHGGTGGRCRTRVWTSSVVALPLTGCQGGSGGESCLRRGHAGSRESTFDPTLAADADGSGLQQEAAAHAIAAARSYARRALRAGKLARRLNGSLG